MDFEELPKNADRYYFSSPAKGKLNDASSQSKGLSPRKVGPRNLFPPHLSIQNKKHPPPRKLGFAPSNHPPTEASTTASSMASVRGKISFPSHTNHSSFSSTFPKFPKETDNKRQSPPDFLLDRETRKVHPPPKCAASKPLSPDKSNKEITTPSTFSSRRKWIGYLLRIFLYIGILAAGIGAYYSLRETRIEGWVAVKDITLPNEIYLVYDFSADIKALRDNYLTSIGPCQEDIQNKKENLKKARTDITALNERLRLLKQQEHVAETEIQIVAKEYQEKADHLWKNEGVLLDQEYDKKLAELEDRFKQRAQQLGINFTISSAEARSPEAWVNAYNLALYNPPPEIDPAKERLWAEEELKKWHNFEKENEAKREELKRLTKEIQSEVGPKIQALREQILRLQSRIKDSELEIAPLEQEYANNERELLEAEETERKIKERFLKDLEKIPNNSIREKIPLSKDGHFEWRRLDQNPKIPPGRYFLWIAIQKEGKVWWSLFSFPVNAFSLTEIVVLPESFIPIDSLLK